jgi:putative transposase
VHHSDRSAAYTSLAFSQRVVELEVDQSFGSTGDCYDNAAVESFFATLKRELAWIHATNTWATRAALRSALFDYIEGFYNPHRIQHRLGHRSPVTYGQDSVA